MAVLLAATGSFLYLRLAGELGTTLDRGLRSRAGDVIALVSQADSGLAQAGRSPLTTRGENLAQISDLSGRVVDGPPPLRRRPLLSGAERRQAASHTIFADHPRSPLDGEPIRLLATPTVAQDRRLIVVVGASLQPRDDALAKLRGLLLLGGPIALLLASLAGYGAAAGALRPVDSMRRRAGDVNAGLPGRRLPVPPSGDEVARLGETLNDMLERLEDALARERRFVADASHELRTPLAIGLRDVWSAQDVGLVDHPEPGPVGLAPGNFRCGSGRYARRRQGQVAVPHRRPLIASRKRGPVSQQLLIGSADRLRSGRDISPWQHEPRLRLVERHQAFDIAGVGSLQKEPAEILRSPGLVAAHVDAVRCRFEPVRPRTLLIISPEPDDPAHPAFARGSACGIHLRDQPRPAAAAIAGCRSLNRLNLGSPGSPSGTTAAAFGCGGDAPAISREQGGSGASQRALQSRRCATEHIRRTGPATRGRRGTRRDGPGGRARGEELRSPSRWCRASVNPRLSRPFEPLNPDILQRGRTRSGLSVRPVQVCAVTGRTIWSVPDCSLRHANHGAIAQET